MRMFGIGHAIQAFDGPDSDGPDVNGPDSGMEPVLLLLCWIIIHAFSA